MRRLQKNGFSVAVSAALMAMIGAAQAQSLPQGAVMMKDSPALLQFETVGRMPYIIGFREMPAVAFGTQLKSAPPPLRGKMGLDVEASIDAYAKSLEGHQIGHESRLKRTAGRDFTVAHRMQHAFNGIIAELSPAEAAALAADPAVTLVEPYTEYLLDDEVGPGVIGAPTVWESGTGIRRAAFINRSRSEVSLFNRRARGEGVVVGVIDTGINFASPSFAGIEPGSGFDFTNPLGAGRHLGTCATGGVDAGRCNDKLIGGWDFVHAVVCTPATPTTDPCRPVAAGGTLREDPSVGDTDGHGSHTAGTSVGNQRTVNFRGNALLLSGIAPRANVIAYDACFTIVASGQGSCPNVSTLAAINQAVADGVDVINYSIGGGAQPWSEAISQAFLTAADAGIFIAASAGNSGPGP